MPETQFALNLQLIFEPRSKQAHNFDGCAAALRTPAFHGLHLLVHRKWLAFRVPCRL